MQIIDISSKQNKQVKEWRKLHRTKGRRQAGAYLVEGDHLIEEALASGQSFQALVVSQTYARSHDLDKFPVDTIYRLDDEVLEDLALTESSQGILAILQRTDTVTNLATYPSSLDRVLLLDAIQDPGNLGTMIRTADAAGYDLVVLGQGTVDLYNDKVIRATQGSLWHLPIIQADLEDWIPDFQAKQGRVLATALHQEALDYRQVSQSGPLAILVGNEGQGVQAALIQAADQSLYIPMPGRAESLNVAVATGVLLFYFSQS